MKICGPKLSLCGLIISVWGIVQLVSTENLISSNFQKVTTYIFMLKVLMGLFFYINSVALIEDLPLEEEYHSLEDFYAAANRAYNQVCSLFTTTICTRLLMHGKFFQNAYNCWIAACIYVLTLLLSAQQFYMNSRVTAN